MLDSSIVTHNPPLETETIASVPAATYGKSSFFKVAIIVCVGIVFSALAAIYVTNNTHNLMPASNDSAVLQWGIGVFIMAFGIVVSVAVAFLVNQADTTSNSINVLRSDIFANFKDFKADVKERINDVKKSVDDVKINIIALLGNL
ncbi:MAG: hypothetical protein LBO66_11805 [Deltaproteobacteria bacterium]|jgi:uncharacterized membrane protein YraQ (UPF0718 family)|nr:hypothetical protein [Deltaproteobacteria bacterium]